MLSLIRFARLNLLLLLVSTTALYAQSTPAVMAHGTLYLSGQGGSASEAMNKVKTVLKSSGMDLSNVVWMNIYLTGAHGLDAMNDVYWNMIGADPPARAVLLVAALPNGDAVEINCIAVADTKSRKAVWPAGWPHTPRSDPPAIRAGEMLYISALGGEDRATGKLSSDFTAETKQALDNVSTVLQAAQMTTKNVVWVNPYLGVGSQYDVMGKVYRTYFEFGNTPGRGTIQVVGLPNKERIVFACIAGADLNKRKAVRPRNMPPSPTASPGVVYGDTLYLSAKDGFIPGQGMVTALFDLQVRQSMRNLLDGLEEADMDFSNVVFSTVYLRDIKDAAQMDALYPKFLKQPYPARTTLQQNFESSEEAAEQISFIAVRK